MKARDIVPGWPQGRSTSRPFHQSWTPDEVFAFGRVFKGLSLRTCIRMFHEAEADAAYHAGQNTMMERYIKEQCIDVKPIINLKDPIFSGDIE